MSVQAATALSVSQLVLDASDVAVPITLPNLYAELVYSVLTALTEDTSIPVADFVAIRTSLLLTSDWLQGCVVSIPAFWSRITISPSTPLTFVTACLDRSELEPLFLCFYATHFCSVQPTTHLDAACTPKEYVRDAIHVLGVDLDRCAVLAIEADSADLLLEVLDGLQWSEVVYMHGILVRFRVSRYTAFCPVYLPDFRFSSVPPIGDIFPPISSLKWVASAVSDLVVSFSTTETEASSLVLHPVGRPIAWSDVLHLLFYSPELETLYLDGLVLEPMAGYTAPSAPLAALRNLDLNFRDLPGVAVIVTRLNAPSLRVVTARLSTVADFKSLFSCSAVLATITKLIVVGRCPVDYDFIALFSQLHRLQDIDLSACPPVFFQTLVRATARRVSSGSVNWHACPKLTGIVVRRISIFDAWGIVRMRLGSGFSSLNSVVIKDYVGGRNVTAESYIRAAGVVLHLDT
ncbi:hypothetical protein C8R46DRAFT_1207162 [Mycena filopes]|nr:hypothetical protein C8R46DRAFT_1207162 [Mycena filopes]